MVTGSLLLLVLVVTPGPASAGWDVCAGAKGACIMTAPYHNSSTGWSVVPGLPYPPGCAVSYSNSQVAHIATGEAWGDVDTEVTAVPGSCAAGAYFDVAFAGETFDALGHDSITTFWNFTDEIWLYLDCTGLSSSSYIFSEVLTGINLWNYSSGSWVYSSANEPATGNGTGSGWTYEDCSSGGPQVLGPGLCNAGCQNEGTFTGIDTYRGDTYRVYAILQGVDPSSGLLPGDKAYGCLWMDDTNISGGYLGTPCSGSTAYHAFLTSIHVD